MIEAPLCLGELPITLNLRRILLNLEKWAPRGSFVMGRTLTGIKALVNWQCNISVWPSDLPADQTGVHRSEVFGVWWKAKPVRLHRKYSETNAAFDFTKPNTQMKTSEGSYHLVPRVPTFTVLLGSVFFFLSRAQCCVCHFVLEDYLWCSNATR